MLRLLTPRRLGLTVCLGSLFVSSSGCDQKSSGPPPKPTPTVTVAEPVEKELADFAEFTGRTEAVESVEIRARVSGYLKEIHFKAGSEVKVDDLLFEIDARTYQAELDRNAGTLANAKAKLKRTDADLAREQTLRDKGINAQADLDLAIAQQGEAAASIQSSEASLERAKLDLDFTKVTAPVAGLTSRELITVGNLVAADSTMLTTIVSLDPIYAYFDVDERTLLDIQQRIREKKMKSARDSEIEVVLGLANEVGFPHVGAIDLVDNRVSATTGTIQVRCRFPNPERVLTPGLFVRVQSQMGPARSRLLVPEQALAQQQGQRYVFVVKPDNKVERRDVTVGRQDGSLRVIETGLQSGEKVIVQGHLRVRAGMEVKPEPYTAGATASATSATDASNHNATPAGGASKSKDH
ncbi:MAG: efflux RND transporter periplasmic adaptor subunit [Candidatus Saccharimonas sp.]|nr:efflux RND transporter periplasmic adaptor subunit [Planctomycetaceae bacterium]